MINTINPESATKDLDILAFNGQIALKAGFPDLSKIHFYEKDISMYKIALGVPFTNEDYDAQRYIAKIRDKFAELLAEGKILDTEVTVISIEEILEYFIKME